MNAVLLPALLFCSHSSSSESLSGSFDRSSSDLHKFESMSVPEYIPYRFNSPGDGGASFKGCCCLLGGDNCVSFIDSVRILFSLATFSRSPRLSLFRSRLIVVGFFDPPSVTVTVTLFFDAGTVKFSLT